MEGQLKKPGVRGLLGPPRGSGQTHTLSQPPAENRCGGCTPEEQHQTMPGDPVRLGAPGRLV